MHSFSLLALAAPLVAAIEFTSPAANTTLSKGDSYTLSWNTVDTDPSEFSIYLVNFVNWPPYYAPLAYNVETASGSVAVDVPCGVDSSYGYQLNAINGTNVYVIYAQTPKFFVSGGPCSSPEPEPVCPPAAVSTTTVTVTVSTTLVSGAASLVTIPPSVAPVAVLPGKCPDTIGWGPSGYHNPVTVQPPRGPRPTNAPGSPWIGKGEDAETRTVYQTVYRDLSEVDGLCMC